jgi:hypothetical protein
MPARFWSSLVCLAALAIATPAHAQIFYQPIQFQYDAPRSFYYGGHDPAVFNFAYTPAWLNGGRAQPLRIYTDSMPYTNARLYGYTIDAAQNEANANAARYFRKSDIVAAKRATPGVLIVPPWAGPDTASAPNAASTSMVRITPSGPHPLMIIPLPRSLPSSQSPPASTVASSN